MTGAAAREEGEEEEGRAAAVEWLCSQRQCGGGSGGKVAEAVVPVGDGDGGVGGGFGGKLAARALCAIYLSRGELVRPMVIVGRDRARGEESEGGRRRP